mgnify:CR=1 FL=1
MGFANVTLRALTTLILASAGASTAGAAPPRSLDIHCRAEWGAGKPTKAYVRHTIERITVHHSGRALTNNKTFLRRLRSAQRFHQTGKRRWADIAYHYLIDLQGKVYEGRPSWARGDTATRYDTTGHLLICVVGNYDKQRPKARQIDALTKLLAWAAERHGVSAKRIAGHREVARTSCPGKHLQRLLSTTLRSRITSLRRRGVSARRVCKTAR